MSSIKGGKGLHGPDKQQDALPLMTRAAPAVRRTPAKDTEPSTSARNRVRMYHRVSQMLKRFVSKTRSA
jgi:hypothetical protein